MTISHHLAWSEHSVHVVLELSSHHSPGFRVKFTCRERADVNNLQQAFQDGVEQYHTQKKHIVTVELDWESDDIFPGTRLTVQLPYKKVISIMAMLDTAEDDVFGGMPSRHLNNPNYANLGRGGHSL